MIASAWLVLELKPDKYSTRGNLQEIKIQRVVQNRPLNELAVKIVLDINPDELQPQVSVNVPINAISIPVEVEELEESLIKVRRGSGELTD